MNNTETIYSELMKRFKEDAKKLISDMSSDIETEILPYVDNDNDFNVFYRTNDVLKALAEGRFTSDCDNGESLTIAIGDFGGRIKIDSGLWSKAAEAILDKHGDDIKDIRIKQLENELADLKREQAKG